MGTVAIGGLLIEVTFGRCHPLIFMGGIQKTEKVASTNHAGLFIKVGGFAPNFRTHT